MSFYKIAGLNVFMNSFGRTAEQAEPYACEAFDQADISVHADWQNTEQEHPYLSKDDCEYMFTGAEFYNQLLRFSGLLLHASAVVVDGKAYLFSANSGTGKSTHTGLWLKYFGDRAVILNDDKPALRLEDGVWYAYGTPWSGKHDINTNMKAELAGIAFLERAEHNSIEPFRGPRAVRAFLEQTSRPRNPEKRIQILELLDALLSQVPVWKLHCNMEPEAVEVSYAAMSQAVKER